MTKKIILDVDTGSDDAIAIMLAALTKDLDLLGISTVNGNRSIDITTTNTLRLVDYLGLDTPVYKGCHLPMVSSLLPGRRTKMPFTGPDNKEEDVHGDYLPLPETNRQPSETHAVLWLIDTLMNTKEKLTLVFVGPLTNLAMALRIEPKITENIEQIVIMGGGYLINNVTAGAEFNFWIDPEAAKIVADCGVPLLVVPLDATHAAYVTWDEALKFESLGTKAAVFCSKLMQLRIGGYNLFQPGEVYNSAPIHDALAVAALIDPDVLQNLMHVNMDVSISPGITDGMSLFDVGGRDRTRRPNANVARDANRKKFIDILMDVFS